MDPKLRLPSVRDQTPLFLRNSFTALCLVFLNSAALACESTQTIRLLKPVNISAELKAEAAALPPLRVLAVDAPPLAHYNEKTKTYTGVGIDIFCFIAKELGLRFEVEAGRDQTVLEKIQQVQNGQADVFIPLSHSEARAKLGLFTVRFDIKDDILIATDIRIGAAMALTSFRFAVAEQAPDGEWQLITPYRWPGLQRWELIQPMLRRVYQQNPPLGLENWLKQANMGAIRQHYSMN